MDNPQKLATRRRQTKQKYKYKPICVGHHYKGNNKITELRIILQRESQNS